MAAYYKKVLIPLALFMAVILFAAPFVAMTNMGIHMDGFSPSSTYVGSKSVSNLGPGTGIIVVVLLAICLGVFGLLAKFNDW